MSVTTKVLSSSREAWNRLGGVLCVYKPPNYWHARLVKEVTFQLSDDLSEIHRRGQLRALQQSSSGSALVSYLVSYLACI